MVCAVQLVLDNHIAVGSRFAGENVGCKRTDSYFRVFDLKLSSIASPSRLILSG